MNTKYYVRRFFRVFIPVLLSGFVCIALFALGARHGQRHQVKDDVVLISAAVQAVQFCSTELEKFEKLKSFTNQSSAEVHELKKDDFCQALCYKFSLLSENAFVTRDSYIGPSGDCVCFIAPNL